jgi:hypothetical protein
MNKFAITIKKPTRAAQASANLANVVPFRTQARRRATGELVMLANEGRSSKGAVVGLWAEAGAVPGRRAIVSNFARGGRIGATGEDLTNEDDIPLTPADFIAIALIFLSVASGPALAWLLLGT